MAGWNGFARKQLEKHGWTEGKGLGKEENGISKAIKVGIKNDTQGVGYKISDQFTFHWWDHIFNKTAKSIVVKENEDGIDVIKEDTSNQPISSKRPTKHSQKPLLYGRFVKASTTTTKKKDLERDSSDDEAERDFSSRHPEDIVFKACGRRTAHKGARHGLKLNGKLKRIEEQERIAISLPCSRSTSPDVTKEHDLEKKSATQPGQLELKRKKKRSRKEDLKSYSDSEACVVKKKKKKRYCEETVEQDNETYEEETSKKKKRIIDRKDFITKNEESNNCNKLQRNMKKNKKDKKKREKYINMEGKKNKSKSSNEGEESFITNLDTLKDETGTARNKGKTKDTKEQDNSIDTEEKETRKTKKKKAPKSVEKAKDKTISDEEVLLTETETSSAKNEKKRRKKK